MIATLQEIALALADRGQKTALLEFRRDDARSWTFRELADLSRRLASGLILSGLRPGDRAVLLGPNRAEWVIACLALLRAGAVPVPVDAQMGENELAHVLQDSEPKWIFTTAALSSRLPAAARSGAELVLFDQASARERSWKEYLAESDAPLPKVSPQDPAALLYTSGTSGRPKGVPLAHANIASNIAALLSLGLISEDERVLLPLPLHHIYPFSVGLMAPLASGVTVIFPDALTGPEIQRALREGEATAVIGVPRMYAALYAAIEGRVRDLGALPFYLYSRLLELAILVRRRWDWHLGKAIFAPLRRRVGPRLRILASGGAALDPDLAWKLQALGFDVATGYGLTETSPILTFNAPGKGRLESAGRPLPGVELRLGPAEGGNGYGEVLAKGPNVFSGYRNLPERTRAAFTEDGYFRTGDLGYFDAEGYLYLTGRASSMIVLSGGENVWPETVEEALERQESIREAGVLEDEDRLAAVIVPEAHLWRDREQLEARLREAVAEATRRLPSHHRISRYLLSPNPLPRNRLGKLRRGELRELYRQLRQEGKPAGALAIEAMSPEDRELLEEQAARRSWDWLRERFPGFPLRPETNLRLDLGIDSLDWINITLEISERAGVAIDEAAIARIETVRDLLREVAAARKQEGAREDLRERLRAAPETLVTKDDRRALDPASPLVQSLGAFVFGLDRLLMRALFRLRVEGSGRLPPSGPLLLAPNHASYLDSLAVAAALPPERLKSTYWAGWVGIMQANPVMRLLSASCRVLPIDPERAPLASIALGGLALRRGAALVWFPEGAISLTGELQPFRAGVGILLEAFPAPVVPVWIEGSYEALPKGKWLPRLVRISVRFGAPIAPAELLAEAEGEDRYQRIAEALRRRMLEGRSSRRTA